MHIRLLPFAAQPGSMTAMRLFPLLMIAATMIAQPFAASAQTDQDRERRLHEDWAWLDRYRAENAALPAPQASTPRIVFMGDSITQG